MDSSWPGQTPIGDHEDKTITGRQTLRRIGVLLVQKNWQVNAALDDVTIIKSIISNPRQLS
jgi:hypothetical protein